MKPIDIIVPYVNCWDPQWMELAKKHIGCIEYNRVRDLGSLRYFFRGVEQNMPWINNVILVLQSESQIPEWLNTKHPKLRIVYHRDYIPKRYLPTFNSNVIELFYHRIKGLTRRFILANDDTVAIKPLTPTDFFDGDKIVYGHSEKVENWRPSNIESNFAKTVENSSIAAGIITGKNNRPFYKDFHIFMPELKYVYKLAWKRYSNGIRRSIKKSYVRMPKNITHLTFYYVAKELGLIKDDRNFRLGLLRIPDGAIPDKIIDALIKSETRVCCLNDQFIKTTDPVAKNTIQNSLHHFLPNKSKFELD